MKPLEYIPKALVNAVLLSMSAWDFLDPLVKFIATIAGIILTIFLVRKAWHDTELSKEQRREKKLLNDMKEQEMWAKVAENKKKYG